MERFDIITKFIKSFSDKFLLKKDALEEVEDHLISRVETYLSHGIEKEDAQKKAIEDFGKGSDFLKEYKRSLHDNNLEKIKNFLSYYIEPKFLTRSVFAFLFAAAIFFTVVKVSGGDFYHYFSLKPFLFVTLLTSILTLSEVASVLFNEKDISFKIYYGAVFGSQNLSIVGAWGFLIGVIMMLVYWENESTIGSNLSFSIMCVFYASIFKIFIFEPLKNSVVVDSSSENTHVSKSLKIKPLFFWGGLGVSCSALVFSIWFLDSVTMFWDIISLGFVSGLSFCPLIAKYGFNFRKFFNLMFLDSENRGEETAVFHSMSIVSLYASLICTIIGLMVVFSNLGSLAQVTQGLAVCFLSLLYGVLFFYIWRFFSRRHKFIH